jgi:acyl-CoA reductase-like NAD-dependent aldehyde dehydrogenase
MKSHLLQQIRQLMAKIPESNDRPERLAVQKTCKLFLGGQFPRTESGRYYTPDGCGRALGNICLASRKDFRDAVVAARAAQAAWAARSAYNRSQILYRIGEMLEGRRAQFIDEMRLQGLDANTALAETNTAIDRLVYYAGWCDKYQQVFGCVNPVASSHFNFSILEPTGVVALIAAQTSPLLGLVSLVAPVIASGNSCVALAARDRPLSAITFGEVLNSSDVPGGVVNILTGDPAELHSHFATHMDVNAVALDSSDATMIKTMQELSAANVKRFRNYQADWLLPENQNPYLIESFCEVKTTWHPIEKISATGSGY